MAQKKDLTQLGKTEVIEQFRESDSDTGSPRVQVALLTRKINTLASHLQKHKQDQHSRRGLLALVGRRRKLFSYLERKEGADYVLKLKRELGIK